MGDLLQNFHNTLDLSALYENIDLNNQITIILAQLENVFDLVASGPMLVGAPSRPPHFDPGDYFDGYSGGSWDNDDNNNPSHNNDNSSQTLPIFIPGSSNSTIFEEI